MSLDLVTLGADGKPDRQVRISDPAHHGMIGKARALNLPLLMRLEDYYADAEIAPEELGAFVAEVDKLVAAAAGDAQVAPLAANMKRLALEAQKERKPILALAD